MDWPSADFAGKFIADLTGDREPLIGLAPGAAFGPAKRWPEGHFTQAAGRLLEQYGGKVLVFGSSTEAEAAQALTDRLGPAAINLAGRTDLDQAVALIDRLDLLITNDSGLMHVADALDAPLIALFGSTSPQKNRPSRRPVPNTQRDQGLRPLLQAGLPQKRTLPRFDYRGSSRRRGRKDSRYQGVIVMPKTTIGPSTHLHPKPAALIGAMVEGKANFMTASWCGIACHQPPALSVAVRKERHTLKGIKAEQAFSVSVPSVALAKQVDYCGLYSGAKRDKSQVFTVFFPGQPDLGSANRGMPDRL